MRKNKYENKLTNEGLDFTGLTYKFEVEDRLSILNFIYNQFYNHPLEAVASENFLQYELYERALNYELSCLSVEDIEWIRNVPTIALYQAFNKVDFFDGKPQPKHYNKFLNRNP